MALPTAWTTFVSTRFAYSIEYPADWTATPATADWPAVGWPTPDGTAVDRLEPPGDVAGQVIVSSDELAPDDVAAGRRAEIDQESALVCRISGTVSVSIDAVEGRRDQVCFGSDHLIEVFVDHGGRIYLIDWFSKADISAADRALFDAMLARFTFAD